MGTASANSRRRIGAAAMLLITLSGCSPLREKSQALWACLHSPQPPIFLENPLFVPACEREFVWSQVVDALDDYFKIEREDRIRLIGEVITEGRIYTFPTPASTCLEPWRRDSSRGAERLMSTFQSLRRRAMARVSPTNGGYLVEVLVTRELEDLDRPEQSTVGGASLRHDGALARTENDVVRPPTRLGWIPMGRDSALEQRILADIRDRLAPAYAPRTVP